MDPLTSLLAKLEALDLAGRASEARALEARLAERAGGEARFWRELAAMRLRMGRSTAAVEAARRACALSPGDAGARRELARALVLNGRWAEGASVAETAAAGSTEPRALAELAGVLLEAGRPDLAAPRAKAAAAGAPDLPGVRRLLAACLRQTGDVAAARAEVDAALRLDPADDEAVWLRSELARATPAAHHVDDLRRRAAARASPQGLYALGKELEDLGDAAAFDAFREGAALKRATLTYDVEADLRRLARLWETHTAAAVRAARPGAAGPAPVFVVGMPRTGTSLVERVLGAHPRVRALGEPPAFDRAVLDAAASAGFTDAEAGRLAALSLDPAAIGRGYVDVLGRPAGVVVDKRPLNALHVAAIRAALPDARIVIVERDLRDAGWAVFKTLFAGDAYAYSYDLADTGRYVAAHRRLTDHWRREFGEEVLTVAYEDVVDDLEGQARRLLAFCGLDWDPGCLRFHESAAPATSASALQVRRPVYASSVGLWRRYEASLRPMVEALAAG